MPHEHVLQLQKTSAQRMSYMYTRESFQSLDELRDI